ncbi:hypothetical protein [Paenibacillus pini]|uniref:Uncharacterized protein n=1 Tax=Paenibacillus pini JCM 16418 TaxID=1236976 RepID=W7YAE2_9BACL|nr:hypothetical protein [Paenibacillus pini]GAF08020.1 hypothetical protein JCM16418_2056 [Paenibacillus pini JCM 16418]
MRAAIKERITEIIPLLKDRLYDLIPPLEVTDDPYAVIALGEEIWKSAWAGYRQVVRLQLYAGHSGLDQADDWARALIHRLHQKRVVSTGAGAFTLYYLGVPEAEKFDAVAGKACRTLRFGVYVPEAGASDLFDPPDEWLTALVDWTTDRLGESWNVYQTTWPADQNTYAVLWRIVGCETKMVGASMYEVRKRYIGHITAPMGAAEHKAAVSLVEELGSKVQIPLDTDQRRYMAVAEASADLQADAILDGQLRLTLVQRRMRPAEDAALIRRVDIHPILK